MPSHLHEALVELFRNRPALAAELLELSLGVDLPAYSEVRIESADMTDVQPAEYRADLVVLLLRGKPVLGIVVEVQLSPKVDKRYAWPVYAVGLRARIRCPVCVLVLTVDEKMSRWARRPIDLGGGNWFRPLVVGPSGVPVITDREQARQDPELSVLSAMAHGKDPDVGRSLEIAVAALSASVGLDARRSVLYADLVQSSLSEAARKALEAMDPSKYEFQSEFAKRYLAEGRQEGLAEGRQEGRAEGRQEGLAEGRQEGRVEGRAELVRKQLSLRFGALPEQAVARVNAASLEELERFAERVLTAKTLEDVLA